MFGQTFTVVAECVLKIKINERKQTICFQEVRMYNFQRMINGFVQAVNI